jgi:hypothetical protein
LPHIIILPGEGVQAWHKRYSGSSQRSHGLIEVSSLATRVKIIAGVLTEALMGGLAAIWLMRWRIAGRRGLG